MAGSKRRAVKRLLERGVRQGRALLGASSSVDPGDTMAVVCFEDAGGDEIGRVEVRCGGTLLQAAKNAGIDIDHFCGGQCSCGTCKVVVMGGDPALSEPAGNEQMVLGRASLTGGRRLACQARVLRDVRVQIPRWF